MAAAQLSSPLSDDFARPGFSAVADGLLSLRAHAGGGGGPPPLFPLAGQTGPRLTETAIIYIQDEQLLKPDIIKVGG
jgi:hypothetical protein